MTKHKKPIAVIVKKPKDRLTKLEKKVQKIAKNEKLGYQWVSLANSTLTNLSRDFMYLNVQDYAACQFVFGTAGNDLYSNKCRHTSCEMDIVVRDGNENANTNMTMFFVRLKDATVYNQTTGALTLVSPKDYVYNLGTPNSAGQVFLSPSKFDIIWQKRFSIGNNAGNLGVDGGLGYKAESLSRYARFHKKFYLNVDIQNGDDNFQQLHCSPDPLKQHYLLIFNDNSAGDLEYPAAEIMYVNHIKVPT